VIVRILLSPARVPAALLLLHGITHGAPSCIELGVIGWRDVAKLVSRAEFARRDMAVACALWRAAALPTVFIAGAIAIGPNEPRDVRVGVVKIAPGRAFIANEVALRGGPRTTIQA
jgi:hypothetical protein